MMTVAQRRQRFAGFFHIGHTEFYCLYQLSKFILQRNTGDQIVQLRILLGFVRSIFFALPLMVFETLKNGDSVFLLQKTTYILKIFQSVCCFCLFEANGSFITVNHLLECYYFKVYIQLKGMERDESQLVKQPLQSEVSNQQVVFIKKDREFQRDNQVVCSYRDQKLTLFTQLQLSALEDDDEWEPSQEEKEIEKEFESKIRVCYTIKALIEQKITSLKSIHIEYSLRPQIDFYEIIQEKPRYSIVASQFFQIIRNNLQLKSFVLKGVLIQEFQAFLKQLRANSQPKKKRSNNQVVQSSKSEYQRSNLKLAINAQLFFEFYETDETLSLISDLTCFREMFDEVGDISVKIQLGQWSSICQWGVTIEQLWSELMNFKNVSLHIQGLEQGYSAGYESNIFDTYVAEVREKIFGFLSQFKQITHLSLKNIDFEESIENIDFLAIEESLGVLFDNNKVKHLRLYGCENFPILPKITTLHSITLGFVSFRKEFHCMKAIIEDNLNLTTIKCQRIQQEWELDDQVFNRLQTLCLMNCQRVVLYNFNRQSLSNLKILCVDIQSIVNLGSLDMMLPKLNYLTFLKLTLPYNGQLEHETLCATPSPHLEQLIVWGKHTIRLRELDLKWPYLQKLYLDKCGRIEESQWSQCQFKGLVELVVPHKVLKLQAIRRLRRIGVRINP